MDEHELEQVFHDANSGNQAARERLCGYCQPLLLARAQFGTFRLQLTDAEDIVQDTMRTVLDHLADCQWRGQRAFHGWLYRFLRRQKSDWLKRQTRECRDVRRAISLSPEDPDSPLPQASQLPDPFPSPVDELIHRETEVRLRQVVAGLSLNQQQILRLRYQEGYSLGEAAELLKLDYGYVRNLQSQALQQLRRELKP